MIKGGENKNERKRKNKILCVCRRGKHEPFEADRSTREKLDLLEIRGVDGKNISELSAKEARSVKKRLFDGGVSVWSVSSPIGKCDIHDDFSAEIERFKRTLESAVILEARSMRIFSFYNTTMSDNTYNG